MSQQHEPRLLAPEMGRQTGYEAAK